MLKGDAHVATMCRYAKTAINDSDITFNMNIFDPVDTGFSVHVNGAIDNRNILDATLFATTIQLSCGGRVSGRVPRVAVRNSRILFRHGLFAWCLSPEIWHHAFS